MTVASSGLTLTASGLLSVSSPPRVIATLFPSALRIPMEVLPPVDKVKSPEIVESARSTASNSAISVVAATRSRVSTEVSIPVIA